MSKAMPRINSSSKSNAPPSSSPEPRNWPPSKKAKATKSIERATRGVRDGMSTKFDGEKQSSHAMIEEDESDVEVCVGKGLLVEKLFEIYSLAFPIASDTQTCAFLNRAFSKYLNQIDPRRRYRFKTIQIVCIDLPLHQTSSKSGERKLLLPLLFKLALMEDQGQDGGVPSTFVFLPGPPHPTSNQIHTTLLARTPSSTIHELFFDFLEDLFKTRVTPVIIKQARMISLLNTLIQGRSREKPEKSEETHEPDTKLSFCLPPSVADAGLSSFTLFLPPSFIDDLTSLSHSRTNSQSHSSSIFFLLKRHINEITSLKLDKVQLVRVGAGRGTHIEVGGRRRYEPARVKFYRETLEDDGKEMKELLSELCKM